MAGKIPQHFIDELLARVDVVEVIDARVTLKKTGRDHMACCPFHDEKTPSFSVSQPKQFYHCFGCGANGNAIGFLMEYENMHFVDAVEALAESVGMDVPRDEQAAKARDETRPLYATLEKVTLFYQGSLRDAPGAIDYLKRRGLSGETAKRFGIGYAPDGWDALQQAIPGEDDNLVKTGMLVPGKDGGRPYQRFRDRIMFPIKDRRGRVIAFGGRVLGDAEPKYLNSPETPLFHKGRELYGLHEARRAAQELGHVVVVEGYMDVVALAHHGVDNAVATLGTAANREHSEALFKAVPNIVFCFDGDRAGRAAAARALLATLPCLSDGRDAHFLFLPDGEDPDSIVGARGAEGFRELLAAKVPIVDFLHEHLADGLDTSGIGGKAQLAERARPVLATIPRGVYRQLATRRFEALVGVPIEVDEAARGAGARPGGPAPAADRGRHGAPAPGFRPSDAPRGRAFGGRGGDARAVGARRTQVVNDPGESVGLTQIRRALMLVLQHPAVVVDVPEEHFEFDDTLPGAKELLDLIGYCEGSPGITTARLLERFRDKPAHRRLGELARTSPVVGLELGDEQAGAELADCLAKLVRFSAAQRRALGPSSPRAGLIAQRRP